MKNTIITEKIKHYKKALDTLSSTRQQIRICTVEIYNKAYENNDKRLRAILSEEDYKNTAVAPDVEESADVLKVLNDMIDELDDQCKRIKYEISSLEVGIN